ncbi:Cof-type HAD-IIB family hydrolase [Alkalicoccus daliensis]|uniref:Cof subfamily of IIB subfamily of haloacid dehalogenase superfamily/HAD-superfamily hydrolase, subfamily IIB n=1 Tax=Alkalicoccus daliensis TaxID=745820 RepID=A0A1H0JZV3_9BACI|nr:Cof-type HAD-IIB family hydrolase [Alkalicoccus daliensis]SDO49318.1 Cof subfamily of IIB subfamily of haloacid dehalogenase superfamily/HAD-superfamily hydrolase, subfamily IIB [Alkalicoccus daliensis]
MQKAVFLDVDGTLANNNGIVPASAAAAVQQARKNGHFIFISTGRTKAELFSDILDIGFDGIIAAAGGYIEYENNVLLHQTVKQEDVAYLVNFFNQHKIDFYLESNGGLYASKNCKTRIRKIIDDFILKNPESRSEVEKGIMPFHDALVAGEELVRPDINKISFLGSDVPIETITEEFSSKFHVIPCTVSLFGKNSGELSIPGIHKATAIAQLLEHLQLSKEHTYAYGDGMNDIEMLEYAQYGIAMGNAKEPVKQAADDITETPDNNGIYNSFVKYGII